MFPPTLWSVHQNNELHFPRTQNNVEAWHRRWNSLLSNKRYGLYTTIDYMKKEQFSVNHTIEQTRAYVPRTPTKKREEECECYQ